MTIIDARERAGVEALLDRESGRFSIDLTSGAVTWATGLERIWGHPPQPSWVVTLELGPGVERAATLDAFAALVAEAGMGGTEVRHVNQTDVRTFGPFAQVWLPEQAALFPELGWRKRGGDTTRCPTLTGWAWRRSVSCGCLYALLMGSGRRCTCRFACLASAKGW